MTVRSVAKIMYVLSVIVDFSLELMAKLVLNAQFPVVLFVHKTILVHHVLPAIISILLLKLVVFVLIHVLNVLLMDAKLANLLIH